MKKSVFYLFVVLFCFVSCQNPFIIEQTKLYTVTFVTNCDTKLDSYRTTRIENLPHIEKTDFEFQGWYTSPSFSGEIITFPFELEGDVSLYAKWQQKYQVQFETDGGTEIENYKTIMITEFPQSFKTGYLLEGWYLNSEFIGDAVSFPYEVTKNTILFAKWIPAFTVTFETNGGSSLDSKTVALLKLSPYSNREGFSFLGWYYDDELTESVSFPLEVKRNLTLYAKWARNYLVQFNSNDGSAVNTESTWCIAEMPVPEKEGCAFGGWFTTQTFSNGTKVCFPYYPQNDVILYAKWNSYSLNYVLNGGINNANNPMSYNEESETIILASPTRNGYEFCGWYDNSSFSGSPITQISKGSKGSKTLYAKWDPKTYSISYNLNGGSLSQANPMSYTIETNTIVLKNPTRKGYEFGGWYTNSSFSGSPVSKIEKGSDGNRSLYAKWTVAEYSLSYNLNGGSLSQANPASYTVETDSIVLKNPTRNGYEFCGWYENSSFSGRPVTQISKGSIGNKILYAKFVQRTYTVVDLSEIDFSKLEDGYTLKIQGYADLPSLETIAEKIQTAANNINLDLKNTTGISVISGYGKNSSIFSRCSKLKRIVLPDSLTTIDLFAFSGCTSIESIEIPSSVTEIKGASNWGGAFYNCSSLKTINIPNGITKIDIAVFECCSSLTTITIPQNVTEIGSFAFKGCSSLTRINIPEKVKWIGANCFDGCTLLSEIVFESSSGWYYLENSTKMYLDVTNSSANSTILKSTLKNTILYKE